MSSAEYQRQHRADHPEVVRRTKELAKARRHALNQLAELHPAEYVVLLDAVCASMGIDPPGSGPIGRPSGGGR